jgi:hypothetical protein
MSTRSLTERSPGLPAFVAFLFAALLAGCSSESGPSGPSLSFTALNPSDAGADAGCAITGGGTRVGCATAYRITGDPYACAGFDDAGAGSSTTCQVVCNTGLVCSLAGLSDGTNAVDCSANCASPEH